MTALRAIAAALLVGVVAGCSSDPRPLTEIAVSVDSDMDVPDELDRITIEITGVTMRQPATADLREQALPRHLSLVHEGGPLGPLTVTATGWLNDARVIEHARQTQFVRGETTRLRIDLLRECAQMFCEAGQTCDRGQCRPIAGGAAADAGADAGSPDVDAGPDAATSAGSGGGGSGGGGSGGQGGTSGQGGSGGQPAPNLSPNCTIEKPSPDDTLIAGRELRLEGSCTDPEQGAVASGLTWSSNRDGTLGSGPRVMVSLSFGRHTLTLCAPDPEDADLTGCKSIIVDVGLPPPPTASIDAVTQGGSSTQPFSSAVPVNLSGTGSGQQVTLAWSDSLVGPFGSAATAVLTMPLVGRHRVVLVVTDNVGQSSEAASTFVVLAEGQTQLVAPFELVNATLAGLGSARVDALAVDSLGNALASTLQPRVYRFDATDSNATASLALSEAILRDRVRAMLLWESEGLVYFATADGLTVCDYAADSGVDAATCTTFREGAFPDNDLTSVARVVGSNDTEFLIAGTERGLFVTTSISGSSSGVEVLSEQAIAGVAVHAGVVWIASRASGLYRYDPVSGDLQTRPGGPSLQLTAVVVDTAGAVWVGSDSGIGRFDPETLAWQTLQHGDPPAPGLASNSVHCLAIDRPTLAGQARDVIWIGTDAGVSRLDPTIPSFMNLTISDGLPSNDVRSIAIMADGTKLFGTTAGVAAYRAP